ncbi:MAG: HNH endonuclease signature motif containing protein [SAR202 cluster bacterium]|nr:HNH endonuclease signature motif containing protein [SAR202 cluster bacterium]MDP6512839.1 HNH endonuclease signature motif containing protein [SAR202 cluster bacterium]MDP6714638.1 HNH endonuclease signature motif containing protein [SAR202 cluster bacterium]
MTSKRRKTQVWQKARRVRGRNPNIWRRDSGGNIIRKQSYGTHGEFGWEIDHKKPISKGGTNGSRNLQPLHWRENRRKSNTYPY